MIPITNEEKKFFCWHKWRISSGMYGDAALDCTKCDATHYTNGLEIFIMRLLGKLVD
jgi:hypothetical protein